MTTDQCRIWVPGSIRVAPNRTFIVRLSPDDFEFEAIEVETPAPTVLTIDSRVDDEAGVPMVVVASSR